MSETEQSKFNKHAKAPMKRSEWLKLTPTEKLFHHLGRNIDKLERLRIRYKRDRASGKLPEPIAFFED